MKMIAVLIFLPTLLMAQDSETKRVVLVKEKLVTNSQYLIIARGYPRPGLTERLQVQGTAREAALLNAQVIARQRFKESLDVIQHGTAKKFIDANGYAEVNYVINYPGIKRYLRDKKP